VKVVESSPRLRSIVTRRTLLPPPGDRADPAWQASWDHLIRLYTPAMVRYARGILSGGGPHEAEDVVQDYLSQALSKGWLARDGADIRCFRAYLQTQLRRHVYRYLEHRRAQKRSPAGATSHDALEGVAEGPDPADQELDRGWVQAAVDLALDDLRQGNADYHEVVLDLLRTDGEGSPDLAERMGRSETQLVHLRHRARKRFGVLFHERLRETVRDEEAFEALCKDLEPYLP
jgi:RNA polymerase sigma factor (sigma-70 family)